MRTAATRAVLALTLFAGACSGPKVQEFTRADAEAIRKTNQEHTAAFNAKDMDKVLGAYAENSVFMPPNAPLLRGKEPLKEFYTGTFGRGAELQMEIDEVAGHGPIGYETGTYSINYGGEQPSRDRGKYVRLLRNTGGTWRIEKMIWSSDLPRPAGAPAN
jgi:ketosteroid isomerase-like protein